MTVARQMIITVLLEENAVSILIQTVNAVITMHILLLIVGIVNYCVLL